MTNITGIDLGSRTTKIVHWNGERIVGIEVFPTAAEPLAHVRQSLDRIAPDRVMATGYGRHLLSEKFGAARVTEIKACARGARHLYPSIRLILDVGGQDCKAIELDEAGRVADFEMNDRCAAGTGKFLEMMAQTLGIDLEALVQMSLVSEEAIALNSMCAVFAESEVVSLITSGVPAERIARGAHVSIARRLASMISRFSQEKDILFVGGGAKNDSLCLLLKKDLKKEITRPDDPLIVTALGAALLAEKERGCI